MPPGAWEAGRTLNRMASAPSSGDRRDHGLAETDSLPLFQLVAELLPVRPELRQDLCVIGVARQVVALQRV